MATANLPSLPHRGAPTTPLSWPLDHEVGRQARPKAAPTRKLTVADQEAIRKAPGGKTRSRSRAAVIPSPLKHPMPWLAAALVANVVLYAATVAHETQLSRWRSKIAVQKQTNVQMRASLSAAKSLPWIDTRARGLGLITPNMIAYLPPLAPPAPHRPAGPIGIGAVEGF